MGIERFKDSYGSFITPQELSEFLGIDVRTVKKYSHHWGGVEVSPGIIRFFSAEVERRLNAVFEAQKGATTMGRNDHGKGGEKRKTIPGRFKTVQTDGNSVGGRCKKPCSGGDDPHGLLLAS